MARARVVRGWSWLGALGALGYGLVFAGAYVEYARRAGEWFADLPVVTVSMPFVLVARFLAGGDYSYSGDMTGTVILAAIFGMALAYVAGWIVATAARLGWRAARGG